MNPLKKQLDTAFSLYIRKRDKHTCFTCGKKLQETESQAGHFISRAIMSLRFDEKNVHCQCHNCNCVLNGNLKVYEARLKAKYGNGIIEELEMRKRVPFRIKESMYKSLIKHYKEK